MAGKLSNRIGNGATMVLGSLVFALAIALTLIKSLLAILVALALVCAGFFCHPRRRGRISQPQAHLQPGPGQFPVCPVLLPGGGRGYHSERVCLRPGRLARGGRLGDHDAGPAFRHRAVGTAPGTSRGRPGE